MQHKTKHSLQLGSQIAICTGVNLPSCMRMRCELVMIYRKDLEVVLDTQNTVKYFFIH